MPAGASCASKSVARYISSPLTILCLAGCCQFPFVVSRLVSMAMRSWRDKQTEQHRIKQRDMAGGHVQHICFCIILPVCTNELVSVYGRTTGLLVGVLGPPEVVLALASAGVVPGATDCDQHGQYGSDVAEGGPVGIEVRRHVSSLTRRTCCGSRAGCPAGGP